MLSRADSIPFVRELLPIGWNIHASHSKALTFKAITLFHSYRDKKIAEQKITFVLLEVYRNIVIRPRWTAARTKDSSTKKFPTRHTPSPFNIKET